MIQSAAQILQLNSRFGLLFDLIITDQVTFSLKFIQNSLLCCAVVQIVLVLVVYNNSPLSVFIGVKLTPKLETIRQLSINIPLIRIIRGVSDDLYNCFVDRVSFDLSVLGILRLVGRYWVLRHYNYTVSLDKLSIQFSKSLCCSFSHGIYFSACKDRLGVNFHHLLGFSH